MDTLPEDIQNKIYKMVHQMKLMEVMCELENEFGIMAYCVADWVYGKHITEEHMNNISKDLYATDVLEFRQNGRCVEETDVYYTRKYYIYHHIYHHRNEDDWRNLI